MSNNGLEPLRIAILSNGFDSPISPFARLSFVSAISSASSLSSISSSSLPPIIDFYDPIVAQQYPDPSEYDLIVLSGGTADPMGNDAWVIKMQKFLQTTASQYPKQKLVGICWGHQTINVAFGGIVGNMPAIEIGVTQIDLTNEGKKIFPFAAGGYLRMHEYHRREVQISGKGFIPLAKGGQSFVNEANTIMTFQGHPEMTANVAKIMLDNTPSYMGLDEGDKDAVAERMELPHDGMIIWKRILEWVNE